MKGTLVSELKNIELEIQNETLRRRILDLESKVLQAEHTAERAVIERELTVAALSTGMMPKAVEGAVSTSIGTGEWKLTTDGKVVRYLDGKPSVDTLGEYLTAEEYFKDHKKKLPSFYSDAQDKPQNQKKNPWTREHWNLTQQSLEIAKSLDDARKMAADAGSSLTGTKPPVK
jgi:hypothetical protein